MSSTANPESLREKLEVILLETRNDDRATIGAIVPTARLATSKTIPVALDAILATILAELPEKVYYRGPDMLQQGISHGFNGAIDAMHSRLEGK